MKRLLILAALLVFAFSGAAFASAPEGCNFPPTGCECYFETGPITVYNTVEVWIPCYFTFGWLTSTPGEFAVQGPHVIFAPTIDEILAHCEDGCEYDYVPCNFAGPMIGALGWVTNYDEMSLYVCRDPWYPSDYCGCEDFDDAEIMQLRTNDQFNTRPIIPLCTDYYYDGLLMWTWCDFDEPCGGGMICVNLWLTCVDMRIDPGTYTTTVYWTMDIDCC